MYSQQNLESVKFYKTNHSLSSTNKLGKRREGRERGRERASERGLKKKSLERDSSLVIGRSLYTNWILDNIKKSLLIFLCDKDIVVIFENSVFLFETFMGKEIWYLIFSSK